MGNYGKTVMTNPTFNQNVIDQIAEGRYTSFSFTNNKYFWTDSVVIVSADIGYYRNDDGELVDNLKVTIRHSSGGQNGLDEIETTDAFIECLQQARQLVLDIRANEVEIIQAYKKRMQERREIQRQLDAERKAKHDADSSFTIADAKNLIQEMYDISKKDDYNTREQFRKLRFRGEDRTVDISSDNTGKIVAFFVGPNRMSRSDLTNFIVTNCAEVLV